MLPQSDDKNVMIIKNECEMKNDKPENRQQSFQAMPQRQVSYILFLVKSNRNRKCFFCLI